MFDLQRLLAETFLRRLEYHDELPSTNDLALQLAVDEALDMPLLVLTSQQTAGRGRGVNRWWSKEGTLTFSVVGDFVRSLPPQRWSLISLNTGLAVCESLEPMVPRHQVAVKWPNDVFLERKKVCGILIESPARPAGRSVIGIGVNVNNSFADAPPELRAIATSLRDATRTEIDLTDVLVRILVNLEKRLTALGRGESFSQDEWRPRCLLTDRVVTVNDGKKDITGVCRGIAEDGALLLQTGAQVETVYSGVVRAFD